MKKFLFFILSLCAISRIAYGDITWSAPVAISTALTNATDARVAIDSSGNATAIWLESGVVKASSLPFGGSWTVPTSISNVLNTSSEPLLKVDSSGNFTAVWVENAQIASAVLPSGGSWGAETFPISGSGASNPSFDVDSSGNAVAVWMRSGFVESSTRQTGTWSLVSVLSATNSSNPHVAISDFGTAMAVWQSVVSSADVIVTDQLTVSTNTWAATKNVFNNTAALLHNYPKVAIDANGNASVGWYRYNRIDGIGFENVRFLTSSMNAGGAAWSIPTIFPDIGFRNPADLIIKLRYDTSGDVVALWTNSFDGETFSVASSRKLFGGEWLEFVNPQSPSLYSFSFDMAIVSGTALLVGMAWDDVSTLFIQSQEADLPQPITQDWSVTNPFSTGSSNAYPRCALSITGSTFNAIAVWTNFDGVNTIINASSGSDSTIDPPSSVSASQSVTDFGVYQDYVNTITWSASSDPNVVQYNIFRDGVFCGSTPDASTFTFDDHNQIQNGTVTYGVAALTSSLRQSPIITYTLFP